MSLSQRKITDAQISANGVVSAPDILTGTANENKQVFDKLIKDIVKASINNVIDDLLATTAAAEIGASVSGMVGTNVAAILTELKNITNDRVAISATTYTEEQKSQIRENIGAGGGTSAVTSVNGHTGAVITLDKKVSISLKANGWVGTESPFSQVITISGSTSSTKVDLAGASSLFNQMILDGTNSIYIENSNGTLTAYALGAKPSVNLLIQATINEVTE